MWCKGKLDLIKWFFWNERALSAGCKRDIADNVKNNILENVLVIWGLQSFWSQPICKLHMGRIWLTLSMYYTTYIHITMIHWHFNNSVISTVRINNDITYTYEVPGNRKSVGIPSIMLNIAGLCYSVTGYFILAWCRKNEWNKQRSLE